MKPDNIAPEVAQYDKPVAYDAHGRPLYAHPPAPRPEAPPVAQPRTMTSPAAGKVVHVVRAIDPIKQEVSEATQKRHDRSVRLYPGLNLSEHEYVIRAVRRHPIGLVIPMFFGSILLVLAMVVLFSYPMIVESMNLRGSLASVSAVAVPLLLFCVLVGIGMYIVYYVYMRNRFVLTNESVIQEIQISLFSRREQTVSLSNIEDASFHQQGIAQQIFNYGSIRLCRTPKTAHSSA
jgi:uncharacterized membrane protein YdbT with pleckstrin-like domain